jgi:hypothetical protein
MTKREWGFDQWKTLIHTLSQGNCILMLGPNMSLEQANGKRQPLTEILANELAEAIKPQMELREINPANLAQMAHYYSMAAGRNGLEAKVESFYEKRRKLTSELHKHLAALPFYFTITSTPDRMYYNALKTSGKQPVTSAYNFRGAAPAMAPMGTVENPLVYNLYGRVEESESLVLTENELIDFLVAVVSDNPPLPKNITSELQASNKSFLFLGFGFQNWYLRVLLHVLQGDKKQAHSFAIEQFPQDTSKDELEQTILFYEESGGKIHIYETELNTFIKELKEQYKAGESAARAAQTSKIEMRPEPKATVFICHASENKDQASALYEKLETMGFCPWLDKENLRGGDEWDQVIKKAIKKEIDYMVILQSRDLVKKIAGYVNKEIHLALDRQDEFRRGVRFIIPARIDDCNLLEELEHLHTIDLFTKKGPEELIKTIRRDQMKRKGDM